MSIALFGPVLLSLVFGLVVSAIYFVVAGFGPWPWRQWLAYAWVLACLCYIILFGVIKVP